MILSNHANVFLRSFFYPFNLCLKCVFERRHNDQLEGYSIQRSTYKYSDKGFLAHSSVLG